MTIDKTHDDGGICLVRVSARCKYSTTTSTRAARHRRTDYRERPDDCVKFVHNWQQDQELCSTFFFFWPRGLSEWAVLQDSARPNSKLAQTAASGVSLHRPRGSDFERWCVDDVAGRTQHIRKQTLTERASQAGPWKGIQVRLGGIFEPRMSPMTERVCSTVGAIQGTSSSRHCRCHAPCAASRHRTRICLVVHDDSTFGGRAGMMAMDMIRHDTDTYSTIPRFMPSSNPQRHVHEG
jgi:hypothetical protein